MTRLGPLTSMALGRSPYDDVETGNGPSDPREPPHQYDERGRIINPETRQCIRDVIRAHNEVMHVIGVAEPCNPGLAKCEQALDRASFAHDARTTEWLTCGSKWTSRVGLWGMHGLRSRIMVYRPYCHADFFGMWAFDARMFSWKSRVLGGLPIWILLESLYLFKVEQSLKQHRWLNFGFQWCRQHLLLFLTLQRLYLIPSSRWFPDLGFFIPCTQSSPVPAPPPLYSLDSATLKIWLGRVLINSTPLLAFYLTDFVREHISTLISPIIYNSLPGPAQKMAHFDLEAEQEAIVLAEEASQTRAESPTLGAADREIRHGRVTDQEEPQASIQRQGTFSSYDGGSREQDYPTDDEDPDQSINNPQMISFDVETSDTAEPQLGMWSAELRTSNDGSSTGAQCRDSATPGKYDITPLTMLPSAFIAGTQTSLLVSVVIAPFEVLAARNIARSFISHRFGFGYAAALADINTGMTWQGVRNILACDFSAFLCNAVIVGACTWAAAWLHSREKGVKKSLLEQLRSMDDHQRRGVEEDVQVWEDEGGHGGEARE